MRGRLLAATLLVGVVLLASGCGDGPDTPAGATPTGTAAASLPKGFPKDKVPVPQDLALATSLTAEVNGRPMYIATFRAPGSNPDAIRSYVADLKNDGFKVKDGYPPNVGDEGGVIVLSDNAWQVGVAGAVGSDSTEVVLSVSREKGA